MDTELTIWGTPHVPFHMEHAEAVIVEHRRQRSLTYEVLFNMGTATVAELSDATGLLPKTLQSRLEELAGMRGHPCVATCIGQEVWSPRTATTPVSVS